MLIFLAFIYLLVKLYVNKIKHLSLFNVVQVQSVTNHNLLFCPLLNMIILKQFHAQHTTDYTQYPA